MAWNYSGDPSAVARDAVRFLVGQTSTGDDVLLYDEEIAWAVSETQNSYYAAAMCAETLAGRYRQTGRVSEQIGNTSITWGERADKLDTLALRLRARAAVKNVTPFLGGQSVADRDTREADTDLRQPAFRVNQFDEPGTSTGSST